MKMGQFFRHHKFQEAFVIGLQSLWAWFTSFLKKALHFWGYHTTPLPMQSPEAVSAVGKLSYNQLVEKIITCKHSSDTNLVTEGDIPPFSAILCGGNYGYWGLVFIVCLSTTMSHENVGTRSRSLGSCLFRSLMYPLVPSAVPGCSVSICLFIWLSLSCDMRDFF